MKIKASRLLLCLALPVPVFAANIVSDGYRDYGTPVNYNYIQVALGGGQISPDQGDSSSVSVSNINGQMMLDEYWLLGINYKGRFTHFDNTNDRADYLSGLLGYRLPVAESTDVVVKGRLGYAWVKSEFEGGQTRFRDNNFMSAVNVGLYHGFSEAFEGRAVVEYMDSDLSNETSVELGGDYYFNPHFGFGAYGKYIFASRGDINHFGVSAKFRF